MLAFPAVDQIESFLTAARPFLAFLLAAVVTGWLVRWDHDRRATRRQAAANLAATTCKHGRLKRRNCHDCAVEFEAEALAERGAGYREDDEPTAGGADGGWSGLIGTLAGAAGAAAALRGPRTFSVVDAPPAKARRYEEIKGLGAGWITNARGTRRQAGPTKTVQADSAETVCFTESEMLHGSAVRALHVALAGCSIEDVARIRVRAAGCTIIDVTPSHLWTLLRAVKLSASPTSFTIPLSLGAGQGAPRDRALRLELDFNRGGAGGTAQLGYSIDQAGPAGSYLTMRSETLGVPASCRDYSYILREVGIISGLAIENLDGIDALRIYDMRSNSLIADFRSGADIRDWCEWITGSSHDHNHSAWLDLSGAAPRGELRLDISTNARWSAVNSFGVVTWVPAE